MLREEPLPPAVKLPVATMSLWSAIWVPGSMIRSPKLEAPGLPNPMAHCTAPWNRVRCGAVATKLSAAPGTCWKSPPMRIVPAVMSPSPLKGELTKKSPATSRESPVADIPSSAPWMKSPVTVQGWPVRLT